MLLFSRKDRRLVHVCILVKDLRFAIGKDIYIYHQAGTGEFGGPIDLTGKPSSVPHRTVHQPQRDHGWNLMERAPERCPIPDEPFPAGYLIILKRNMT